MPQKLVLMYYLKKIERLAALILASINIACNTDVLLFEDESKRYSDSHLCPEKTFSVENEQVRSYLDFVKYTSGFKSSEVKNFALESGYRMDEPASYCIPSSESDNNLTFRFYKDNGEECDYAYLFRLEGPIYLSNLIPGHLYVYEVTDTNKEVVICDSLYTVGQVRMIKTESGFNIRDIGGWRTRDGKRTVYGRIYRGCAFPGITPKDQLIISKQLGVSAEIDLRSNGELNLDDDITSNDQNHTKLGKGVKYYHYPLPLNGFISEDRVYCNVFKTVINSLKQGDNIYIHCAGGADRTGAVMLLLEALLNVQDSEMAKDYELTSFAPLYYDKNNYRYCTKCQSMFNHFAEVAGGGSNTNEITTNYMLSLGVTQEELDSFKRIMLEPVHN